LIELVNWTGPVTTFSDSHQIWHGIAFFYKSGNQPVELFPFPREMESTIEQSPTRAKTAIHFVVGFTGEADRPSRTRTERDLAQAESTVWHVNRWTSIAIGLREIFHSNARAANYGFT